MYFWFSRRFFWFCKNLRENQKNKKTNPYPRVGLKPLKTLFLLVFPNVSLVVFGFLLYFWFSRGICWFCKNLRENQQQHKTKPISKGESETLKKKVVCVFPNVFGFSLVFFCIFGFLEGFVGFVKTFGKTKKTKKQNPYPRVSLKPLKLCFCWFCPNAFLVFFGFLWYVWFSRWFFVLFTSPTVFGYFVWVFAWFYISSVVLPARRDIFVTPQVSDSYTIAGTTTTTTTTNHHHHHHHHHHHNKPTRLHQ